jgi:hypothetical protein
MQKNNFLMLALFIKVTKLVIRKIK